MNDRPVVSVIIPNWNGCEVLQKCLASLYRGEFRDFEVVLVDNASKDESVALTRRDFPQVRVLPQTVNHGFSKGCNLGVQEARGKYVALFNNDMEVEPDWLTRAVAHLESDPAIAAVQPKLKSIYDKTRFDYSAGAGGLLDRFGYGFALGRVFDEVEHDAGQYDTPRVIFWAGCMIARRDLYLEAGGLDESYFAHFEEIDLCWRMQLLGYRIESEPRTIVYHYNAYTIRAASGWKMYLNHRNSVVTLIKNLPAGRLLAVLPLRGALDALTMLTSAFRREPARVWAVVRAHGWIWGHLPRILGARRRTRRLRRVPDEGVLSRLYPGSVVWDYFARGRRTAADILGK